MKQKLKWIVFSLLGLYLLFGFFVLPYLITTQVPQIVKEKLGAELSIGDAGFDPLGFELHLYDISFASPKAEPLLRLKEAIVNVELYAVFMGTIRLKEIGFIEPELFILKDKEGVFNFSWLLESNENQPKEAEPEEQNATLPPVVMEYFHIKDAGIVYNDISKKVAFSVALSRLGLRVHDIDTKNMHHSDNRIRFFSHINDGGFIDVESEVLSLEPLALQGSVNFESGKIFTGWSYLQEILNLEIADGKMHAHTHFFFDSDDLNATHLNEIALRLERLRIKPKNAYHDILTIKEINLNDGSLYPLTQIGRFDTLEIHDSALHVKRLADGSLNWEHHAKLAKDTNTTAPAEPSEGENTPWDVMLNNFAFTNFKADIYDEGITPSQHFVLNDFNLSAQNIHSIGNHYLDYQMGLRFNEAMACESEGALAHSYLDAKGTFTCKGIDLRWFEAYVDEATDKSFQTFDLRVDKGVLGFSLPYQIKQDENATAIGLDEAKIALDDFKLKQKSKAKTLMRFSRFSLDGIDLNTTNQTLHVKRIDWTKPRVYAKKSSAGDIDLSTLVVPKKEPKNSSKASDKTLPSTKSSPWLTKVDSVKIARAGLYFDDASLSKTAQMSINELNLHVSDISSDLSHTFNYESNMRINSEGKLFLSGNVRPEPLLVNTTMNLQSLQLRDANPYIAQSLKLYLDRGSVDMLAKIRFEPDTSRAEMRMNGEVAINDFVANVSDTNKTIIAFNKVSASPFYFDLKPDRLAIEELEIASLYSNVHIDANKTLNFSKLLIQKPEDNNTVVTDEVNTSEKPKEAFAVSIVKLDFKDGVTDFADDSLPLKFYTNIHDVGGTIYGISTDEELTSYVNLSGVIDQYGAMKVDGSLNSGNPKMFTDINVNFRNLALNNMSPYSANFAGRKIDEGKLSLDLKYKIVASQILGDNSIIINKIKLGEAFEGESSLPLGLAIALLEDNEGVIDINMPVQGDMDAPDFKYGALVMKTLGNLIIKVVSAPFSFLGSMLGVDGEELKFIAYEPGQSMLLPPEREKLDALATALQKRQKLSLEVSGSYDLKTDRFALQREKLQELVLKRSDQKEENMLLDLDYVEDLYDEFYNDESRKSLESALKEKYEKGVAFEEAYRNALTEGVILKQEVSPAELDFLARARGVSIKNYLKVSHDMEESRIILIDNSVSEKSDEGLINSEMNIVVKE
jgi:hypothetical protein